MNDNNNEETVIDLSQLFGAVRKSIVSIIIWGIAGLLVSLFATFDDSEVQFDDRYFGQSKSRQHPDAVHGTTGRFAGNQYL